MKIIVEEQLTTKTPSSNSVSYNSEHNFINSVCAGALNLGAFFKAEQLQENCVKVSLIKQIAENKFEEYAGAIITENKPAQFTSTATSGKITLTFKLEK